jgi:hypothetical protein
MAGVVPAIGAGTTTLIFAPQANLTSLDPMGPPPPSPATSR